jgi:hypothetical protein
MQTAMVIVSPLLFFQNEESRLKMILRIALLYGAVSP